MDDLDIVKTLFCNYIELMLNMKSSLVLEDIGGKVASAVLCRSVIHFLKEAL